RGLRARPRAPRARCAQPPRPPLPRLRLRPAQRARLLAHPFAHPLTPIPGDPMKPLPHAASTPKATLALAALLLAGCDLFDPGANSPQGVAGLESSGVGVHRDSLKAAQSRALHDGLLYVTHRHAAEPGPAVVDTATGLIVAYYPHLLQPSGIAFT